MIVNRLIAVLLAGAAAAACAPELPRNTPVEKARWLDQGWSPEARFWFHHATQGTSTLPVPYKWFVALEQPRIWFFGDPPMLKDSDYLRRFGFIPSPRSLGIDGTSLGRYGYSPKRKGDYGARTFAYDEKKFAGNPDGLPVGFARLKKGARDPVSGKKMLAQIGFTCAACHTGQLEFNGVSLRIDGAPAVTDLGKLRQALGLSLVYTKYVPFRFGGFADRVLGEDHTSEQEANLKRKFDGLLEKGKNLKKITDPVFAHNVEEGFARLDALNRIGNQVFFENLLTPTGDNRDAIANLAPMTAPVNFPHIWDTSWFLWVQYDGSIMQPMVRNAGEALGVKAKVNMTNPIGDLYRSAVELGEIFDLERLLAGDNPWSGKREFKGLRAPKWPENLFRPIDPVKKEKGRKLYMAHCQGCHLPAVNDPSRRFWDPALWTKPNEAGERYLKFTKYRQGAEFANFVSIKYVGTDPAQAEVMVKRQVRTPIYLGIDPKALCDGTPGGVVTETLFAKALAAVVEKTATRWYDDHNIDPAKRKRMDGYRPNCIRAEMYYKARPLDGIWATAPFLHNGSVPNLYELLSPADERSKTFYLGSRLFDPKRVGYQTDEIDGGFELDTTKPGNSNQGHEFKDAPLGGGVIGPLLKPAQREALIEYLKSL